MLSQNGNRSILKMPKYEITRSYTVYCIATVEADSHKHAKEIALYDDSIPGRYDADVYWKEYDGDYEADITVEEIEKS